MSIFAFSLFEGWGSRSSDITGITDIDNPLPPCPDSPNCVRITKKIDHPIDQVFQVCNQTIEVMDPAEISISKQSYKVKTVFRVFLFRDDMILQLTERDSTSAYLHIRSASRVGYSDLGVNRRRVKTFLRKIHNRL